MNLKNCPNCTKQFTAGVSWRNPPKGLERLIYCSSECLTKHTDKLKEVGDESETHKA